MTLRTAVALSATALAAAVAFQQAPRTIALRPADATLGEPLTSIYSIRELADGRVLVSDNSVETRLVVADLAANRVRMIGNIGAGPGEYRRAGRLWELSADSTLLIDAPERGRRWLLLRGDSIVKTLPPDLPEWQTVGADIRGADARGLLLGIRGAGADQLSGELSRERDVAILGQRGSTRKDTIAHLRGIERRVTQAGTKDRPMWIVHGLMGSGTDQVLLYPDGWIAIARQEPYRIEWRRPDGFNVRGPDITWEAPRSTDREKQAALERLRKRYGPDAKDPGAPWAERLAPFRSNALIAAPDGNLLVLRSQWSQAINTNYDLFDRTGSRIGTLAMHDSERVVGFGPRSVYVVSTDGDGFQHLRRHPWP